LSVGEEVELGIEAVAALRVRAVNTKEAFTLGDSAGHFFRASVLEIAPDRARVTVYEKMPTSPESPATIVLLCAVLSRQRMMLVAQKATELGVIHIVPVISERSVQFDGLDHEKSHAWPGQVARAARQCRRATLPLVHKATRIESALESSAWTGSDERLYLDDRAAKNSGRVSLPKQKSLREPVIVALAIGPEGGFTDHERRLLEDRGGKSLRLGARVLRAETAVFVGLTLVQYLLGDLGAE
jgi:16S rRNA (uracil1498-N3)-methyltransferase